METLSEGNKLTQWLNKKISQCPARQDILLQLENMHGSAILSSYMLVGFIRIITILELRYYPKLIKKLFT